jgi:thiamine biosynthesis protein ThiS
MKINSDYVSINDLPIHTVAGLISYFKLNPQHVAVDLNGVILEASSYPDTRIKETDTIELIHFVGGG